MQINEKELSARLDEWFKQVNKDKNFWNRNPIAKIIKKNLILLGNFKNKPGGNPHKAKKKREYNIAVLNGYEGKFEDYL